MQLEFNNLADHLDKFRATIVKAIQYEIERPMTSSDPDRDGKSINYTGELKDSTRGVLTVDKDSLTLDVTMLERYKYFMPDYIGGVQASVNDIAQWVVRKPMAENIQPTDVYEISKSIVNNLSQFGYSQTSRVDFIANALEKKRNELRPAQAILLDIKEQIKVILKEAGINTEGKEVNFI